MENLITTIISVIILVAGAFLYGHKKAADDVTKKAAKRAEQRKESRDEVSSDVQSTTDDDVRKRLRDKWSSD